MIRSRTYSVATVVGVSLAYTFSWNVDAKAATQSTIRGVVTDSKGEPISGATILLNAYEGPPLDPIGPTAKSDKFGRYELRMEVKEPITVKEILVSHPGFVRITHTNRFTLKPRQEVPLSFELTPGEVISGRVEPPRSGRTRQDHIFVMRVNRR